ncbi:hypothetical protein Bbelb_246120 [Branchiostoma belcheri]|nr:hypothetical protein Bbelb_246120 [Branchiostoma belcheri]
MSLTYISGQEQQPWSLVPNKTVLLEECQSRCPVYVPDAFSQQTGEAPLDTGVARRCSTEDSVVDCDNGMTQLQVCAHAHQPSAAHVRLMTYFRGPAAARASVLS